MATSYDADEVNRLFEISKGHQTLKSPILCVWRDAGSETLGMKWDAIRLERD